MARSIANVLSFARLQQMPKLAKRAAGLSWSQQQDFFPAIDDGDRQSLVKIAGQVRGADRAPALFVHGIMPRSGTNYLSDILALHPDVQLNPGRLYEFPLLYISESAQMLQQEFTFMFPRNGEVMGKFDMLGHMASGWLAQFQAQYPAKRLLLKDPHVHGIGLFPSVFPGDKLFLLIRDGRDVVASSMATFGKKGLLSKNFKTLVLEWRESCEAALRMARQDGSTSPALLVRYEDIAIDPAPHVPALLAHAGLDPATFDMNALASLSVRGSSETAAAGAHWKPVAKSANFSPIGRWSSWTAPQKQLFKSLAGETLIKAGYESSPDW